MNRLSIFSFIIVLISIGIGCDDFLEKVPPSSLAVENFFQNEDDAISAVNAVYAPIQLRGLYSEDYPKVAEVPSDDMTIDNTSGLSFDDFGFSPAESQIDNVFTLSYEGIGRANLVINRVPEIDMDAELQARIIGEAKFMRALYYWHLAATFGEVPVILIPTETTAEAEIPKSPVADVYNQVITDLQEAIPALPDVYDAAEVGRATSGAARSLLGKAFLYAERYADAEATFEEVINSGIYDLVPDVSQIIIESNENNVESIFEVQYSNIGGGGWSVSDAAGINETTLRERLNYPNGRGGFGNLLPTQSIVDEFEEGDPRLDAFVFREGDTYDPSTAGEEVFDPAWTPTGFAIKKGMLPFRRNLVESGTNWPVIRFADVLLMYAEAANENGNLAGAVEALNRVRERATMPPYPTADFPVSTAEEVFEAIVHERRVELAFEYHRFNDLRRWGLAPEILSGLGYTSPRNRFMPLPQAEVDTNPNLDQNPNF